MGMAINDSYRNKAGETVESTCFVEVVVWGRQAETCAQYLRKGSPVLVEGRLQYDQWENKEGEKRSRLRVVAVRVQFLSSPKRAEYGDAPGGNDAAPGGNDAAAGGRAAAGPRRWRMRMRRSRIKPCVFYRGFSLPAACISAIISA